MEPSQPKEQVVHNIQGSTFIPLKICPKLALLLLHLLLISTNLLERALHYIWSWYVLWIFGGMEEEDTFSYEFAYYKQKSIHND